MQPNVKSNLPTAQAYGEVQAAYDHFNAALFEGELPQCLITLQREKKTVGYFSHKRFANLQGQTTDEIALNPSYFAVVPMLETLQTLVHEMAHLWQAHFGRPGRGRYHNEQWAAKMELIGLMPSSTGKPGGERTGDSMADYPIQDGRFLVACEALCTRDFQLSWYDRYVAPMQVEAGQNSMAMMQGANVGGGQCASEADVVKNNLVISQPASASVAANKSNRLKYTCDCASVWGKPGLNLMCLNCSQPFLGEN